VHGTACALATLALLRGPRWTRYGVPAWFTVVAGSAVLNWWVPYHPVVPDVQHTLIHALLIASAALSAAAVFGRRGGSR
jgi:hypothetical protein